VTREAGLAPRPTLQASPDRSAHRPFGADTALRFTGLGRDTLSLRLLFETEEPERKPADVRDVTSALFRLAAPAAGHGESPCPVQLYWGKTWSFHGAISRIAERIDRFSADGTATRSWISLEVEALPNPAGPSLMQVAFGPGRSP